jgi:hypothetical protein
MKAAKGRRERWSYRKGCSTEHHRKVNLETEGSGVIGNGAILLGVGLFWSAR